MNHYQEIFDQLLPEHLKQLKPIIMLLDIDHDQLYEIVGLYQENDHVNFRILKYKNNKWCIHYEKNMAIQNIKKLFVQKVNDQFYFNCNYLIDQRIETAIFTYQDHELIIVKGEQRNKVAIFPAYINAIGGKIWGYINDDGRFVIKSQFTSAKEFQENGIAIVENQLSGLINTKGEFILVPKYQSIYPFNEHRAIVIDDQGFGVIDETGKQTTKKSYDIISDYHEQRALFSKKQNDQFLYGYLDLSGNEIIQAIYLEGSNFSHGKALVKLRDYEYHLINPFGKVLTTYHYYHVSNLGDGMLAFKQTENGLYGYINENGKVQISPIYSYAYPFSNGRAVVMMNEDQYGLINKNGQFIIKPEFNQISDLGANRYAVGINLDKTKPYLGYKYALATRDGKILTDFKFRHLSNFIDHLSSAYDETNTYFIDLDGNVVNQLPMIKGQGSMEILNDLIKVNMDYIEYYIKKDGSPVYLPYNTIRINENTSIKINKYKPNQDYLVYYPSITGVKPELNEKLKEKSQIKAINPNAQLDYTYYGNFTVSFYQKDLLSIKFEGYNYPFGAAHGMPYQEYCHIDLKREICYELKDLFKDNVNYVKVLSDIIAKQIKNDSKYDFIFPNAYHGIAKDQPFFIDDKALYLYFSPYDIAPYVAGFVTFKIPFEEIESIINMEGDFWRAFH